MDRHFTVGSAKWHILSVTGSTRHCGEASPRIRPANSRLRSYQFPIFTWFVFHDVSGDRAGCHGEGAGQIHLAGSAASGEITVLGADDNLIGTRSDAGSGVNASAATRFDYMCACFVKNFKIALAHAIVSCLLLSELNVELH